MALIHALKALRILARSIEWPLRQIVEDAGEGAGVVLNSVKARRDAYGYNSGTDDYGNLLEEGILRPAIQLARDVLHHAQDALTSFTMRGSGSWW